VSGQVLGDVSRVQFGAAVDGLTVPLYDDGDFNCGSSPDGGLVETSAEPVDDACPEGVVAWLGSGPP
jgi:hypothetical protein